MRVASFIRSSLYVFLTCVSRLALRSTIVYSLLHFHCCVGTIGLFGVVHGYFAHSFFIVSLGAEDNLEILAWFSHS